MYMYFPATQMWCLGRLLPLMIGERIQVDDDHWLNFLRLLTIIDYLLAPVVSPECVGHLTILIDEHHRTWKELYPTSNIIPKMHYLIHYPEFIERYVWIHVHVYMYMYIHVYMYMYIVCVYKFNFNMPL